MIDKPVGQTSSDTVNELKRILNLKRIGHSGTLDKFASGLLIVCTGWATKLARYFLESDKRYIARIKLGIVTDTCDPEGKIIEERKTTYLTPELIFTAALKFKGEFDQMPPLYSALKVKGKRASDLTRKGKNISLKKRKVNITKLDILKIDLDNSTVTIDVTCSKGTYIRSLAKDIGDFLGTGGHLESLRRIASGNFSIENAATINELKESADDNKIISNLNAEKKYLYKPEEALTNFSYLKVKNAIVKNILNGAFFLRNDIINIYNNGKNPFIILDEEENLIAIADIDIDNWSIKYLNVFNKTS
ncbi:MAG: tRNA pseudouridine(55) synthase TruB [Spirochaetota bacterium]